MSEQQRPAWAVRLQAEREAQGWGPFETARRLREAANITRHPTKQVKSLARLVTEHERGKVFPTQWAPAYAAVYGIPRGVLFPDPPPDPQASTDAPGTVDTSIVGDTEDDVKRRALLRLIAALSTGAAVAPGELEALLSDIDNVLDLNTDVEEWEQVVYDYGHQIYRRPFESLLPAVAADIYAVGELLDKGRPPGEQAGLLRVSAGLSGVLAEIFSNMGDDRAARRSWYTARRAADASGDRRVRVWARGRAAQNASWAGGSHETVMTLVSDAAEIADGVPSSGLARAYAAGAYMAAFNGDTETARDNIESLKRTFDQLPQNSNMPTVLDFQVSQLYWNEAYVGITLGDKGALTAVDNSHACYPPTATAPIINLHLMRAINLLQCGEVGEALDLAATSLHDRPRPVMATRQLVDQMLGALPGKARTLPAARELRALTS
ncbi:XRE family transcriptional regulator [Actinomadura terrae]|uniref:XRE family transcriptional regulator n=1 Tax=Actinomadura terrae TaxID=604353 RepID=UPI001FA754C0|nr:XRE family transcriptional regulator [Actinomadura terrae]